MKRKFLLFFLVVAFTTFSSAQYVTRIIPVSIALQYAKSYCNDSDGKYDYYRGAVNKIINGRQYYYIFVDQQPNAGWEHPCKHIYVNVHGVSVSTPIICEDDTRPLDNVDLKQLSVKKRYSSHSTLKPKVAKINTNAGGKNKFAGNTYAIILSGGMNKTANDVRYWNDCSFIYQTLRNRYDIPKKNIKVIMADGTDPGDDMTDSGGEYVSSPLDLDGDGVNDIEYSATKENVTKVIRETASKLKDADHLLLYVIDHGGYDKQKKQAYICLWGEDKLYPDELNDCLSVGDAGYIDIVMGQCNSGGFVEALKGNNRIIATACAENEKSYSCAEELPFDEFVYHWTSALNGYDAFGNKTTASDGNGHVTMAAAYNYARENDMYANGKFPYAEETPTLTMLSNSTAESLALDTIPNVVDLYITRGEIQTEDTLSLSTVTDKKPFYMDDSFINKPFWDSSDIWVRHNPDGFEYHINQSQTFPDTCNVAYVYVNVRNRGVKPYKSDDWMVKTYYARSSMKIGKKVWLGKSLAYKSNCYGKEMDVCFLDRPIQPGGNFIAEIEYPFNKTERSYIHKPDFNMCILAFLTPNVTSDDDMLTDDDYQIPAVWRTNKLAQKNLTTILYESRVDDIEMEPTVMVPLDNVAKEYKIRVMPSSKTGNLFKDMRLTMNVPTGSVLAWSPQVYKNGAMLSPAVPSLTSVALSDSCVINAVTLSSSKTCALKIKAEANADNDLDEQEYKFHLALYDANTDALLGGETYMIKRGARKKIDFAVDSRLSSGKYELTATSASEEVSYRWYDSEGNLVGNGCSCEVPANSKSTTYTVEAVSASDGAYCRKAVSVERKLLIDKVRSTDSGMIEVTFTAPVPKGMSLNLSSSDGTSSVYGSQIPEDSKSITLNGSNISHGTCQLTLVENGTAVESRKFIK